MTNEPTQSRPLQAGIDSRRNPGASSTSHQPLPAAWIESIFKRLSAFYGSKFADLWHGCDIESVKSVWARELAGYSPDELASGIAACRSRDWPPTLPEFLKACRPPIDYEQAFIEAVEQMRRRANGGDTWSNPAVYWAAVKLGTDLSAHPYQAVKNRWAAALDEAVGGIRDGKLPGIVPARMDALPAPGGRFVAPEEARRQIEGIRDMLARKMTQKTKNQEFLGSA